MSLTRRSSFLEVGVGNGLPPNMTLHANPGEDITIVHKGETIRFQCGAKVARLPDEPDAMLRVAQGHFVRAETGAFGEALAEEIQAVVASGDEESLHLLTSSNVDLDQFVDQLPSLGEEDIQIDLYVVEAPDD